MACGLKQRRPTAAHAASDGGVVPLSRNCHSATDGWKSGGVLALGRTGSAVAVAKIRPRLSNVPDSMFRRVLAFIIWDQFGEANRRMHLDAPRGVVYLFRLGRFCTKSANEMSRISTHP